MISVATCTGYNYHGNRLPLTLQSRVFTEESEWFAYRDNMTYLSIGFSDWEHDQNMLLFLGEQYIPFMSNEALSYWIEPYVVDNRTPQIHLLFMQDTDLDNGQLKVWHGLEMPVVNLDEQGEV